MHVLETHTQKTKTNKTEKKWNTIIAENVNATLN